MKKIFILIVFTLNISMLFAQGGASSCAELQANFQEYQSCATSIPFANSTGGNSENFNTTCIPTAYVGPTWFFLEIKDPGTVTLQISQTDLNGNGTDVDFAIWGPFQNLNNICSQLNPSTEVDCSYLPDAIETVSIPASNSGDLYVLLIDNYSGVPGNITVTQTGGTGTTNCDFLSSVEIKNSDNTTITQFDYCKPSTKDLTAFIDTSDFNGNLSDLRFNYTWFRNNVQISSITNSNSDQNTIQVNDSGIYKVVITSYDIVNNPNQNSPIPVPSENEVELFFHTTPQASISNSSTQCLNNNPVLSITIDNLSSLNPQIDQLTYEWYLNNTLINGADNDSFTPTQPGIYNAIVRNNPCIESITSQIEIFSNPNVSIANDQTICSNDSYTITSTLINGNNLNSLVYEWFKDGIPTGVNTPSYTVSSTNQAVNTTSTYYLSIEESGLCVGNSNPVSITINENPTVNPNIITLEQCDYLNSTIDGFAETNLLQLYDEITLNTPGLTLYFYEDPGLTSLISNSTQYVNTSAFNQTLYAIAVNENVNPSCSSLNATQINLIINPTSPSTYPDILPVCPEVNQNYGFIDFEAQRILIKNTFFPSSNVIISFHLTPSDASTGLNELNNTSQIPIGSTIIHTKIVSTGTKDCLAIGTFLVSVVNPPLINVVSNEDLCANDIFTFDTKDNEALIGQTANTTTSYFPSFLSALNNDNSLVINKTLPFNLVIGTNTYYIRVVDNSTGCVSILDFDLRVFPNPTISQPNPIKKCGYGTATFDLTSRSNQITNGNINYQVTFYATTLDQTNGNAIVNTQNYISGNATIIVVVEDPSNLGCTSETTLSLEVLELGGSFINPSSIELCNDSGYEVFNLRSKESEMLNGTASNLISFKYYKSESDAINNTNINLITNPSNYINSSQFYEKVFVRLTSNTLIDSETSLACFRVLELDLYVRSFPVNNLLDIPYVICVDELNNIKYPATINTQLNNTDYQFTWYTGFDAINGNEITGENGTDFQTIIEGEFSVKITNISNTANCTSVFNFTTILSTIPMTITVNPNEIVGLQNNTFINVLVTPSSSDYEYSIDGVFWQDATIFENLEGGLQTVSVRNKKGCGLLSTSFIVLDYPNFFTPNNDGYNDTWNIIGTEFTENSKIFIFDRYGKLLKQISPNGIGWDGSFQDRNLPSDDYWFTFQYTINDKQYEFKSHFTLKR